MTIDDEKVRFYLLHRDQLEEWSALRADAAAAIDEWLRSLQGDLEAVVGELGDDVKLVPWVGEEEGWPGLYLKCSWWPEGPDEKPLALIGLQWARGKTLLGPSSSPYVGLRIKRDVPVARTLREDKQYQEAKKIRRDTATPWWAALGYVPPEAPFPDQAEAYRSRLINAIRQAWTDYSPAVNRALRATVAPSSSIGISTPSTDAQDLAGAVK
jgi:hypothetical protein